MLSRLQADLTELAAIVEPGTPGITRRFPSPAYLQGRAWLRARMEAAGLAPRVDAAGNLFGSKPGKGAPILIGSHTDTVYAGGRYDGALGVLAALEAARQLDDLRHPLVVADYLAEEANDFGISCVGSRALAGVLNPEWLSRSLQGQTLAQAIEAAGGNPSEIAGAAARNGDFAACLELHIEQGPVLEARGIGLGVVTGIVGITRGLLELEGQADHAGTAPMDLRRDAMAAAATVVLALEQLCQAEVGAVGTVGRLEVSPNQANVVPGKVTLTAEIRHLDATVMERLWGAFLAAAETCCRSRGIRLVLGAVTRAQPSCPPDWLVQRLTAVCQRLDPRAITLPSGAGHDTGHLSRIAPAAMLFVPSVGGRSHCPEEDTRPEHLLLGLQALSAAVRELDELP